MILPLPCVTAIRITMLVVMIFAAINNPLAADVHVEEQRLPLQLRDQVRAEQSGQFTMRLCDANWDASRTAIIVCDAWDLHHSRNAVRRLEEFAPRLNEVLIRARALGVTIIHAPSDCMPFYADHPARQRARKTPKAANAPKGVEQWCVQIPAEERADYPIDQSDGGEDDDPVELARWAEHLKSIGRNPQTPWQRQTPLLTIDPEKDYISSYGDEVWNILEDRGIEHVILTGVHLNMCVLGRPFGLRQMVRGGKNVVLMRDMTDTMYNPARWPYVSHFEGTDLMVAYIERNICPTITSDQLIGGQPFQFKDDRRDSVDTTLPLSTTDRLDARKNWVKVSVPLVAVKGAGNTEARSAHAGWYRCVVRIPEVWKHADMRLELPAGSVQDRAWINGRTIQLSEDEQGVVFAIIPGLIEYGTANLLVIHAQDADALSIAPVLIAEDARLVLRGSWQFRVGDDPRLSGMPLPAQFGAPGDIVFQPADHLR